MDQDMEVESPSKPRANGSSGKATTSRRPHMGGVSKSRQERQFHPYTPGQKRELKNTKRLLQEREEELARTKAELREKEKTLDRVLPVVRNFYEERAVPQYKDLLSVLAVNQVIFGGISDALHREQNLDSTFSKMWCELMHVLTDEIQSHNGMEKTNFSLHKGSVYIMTWVFARTETELEAETTRLHSVLASEKLFERLRDENLVNTSYVDYCHHWIYFSPSCDEFSCILFEKDFNAENEEEMQYLQQCFENFAAYYKAQTPWEKVAPQLHHWRQCKGYKGPLTVLLYVPPCFNAIMETEVRIPQTESLCCDLDQHMPPFLFFSFPSNIIRPHVDEELCEVFSVSKEVPSSRQVSWPPPSALIRPIWYDSFLEDVRRELRNIGQDKTRLADFRRRIWVERAPIFEEEFSELTSFRHHCWRRHQQQQQEEEKEEEEIEKEQLPPPLPPSSPQQQQQDETTTTT